MDFRVILSKKALRELGEITRFIAKENPDAARELRDKLLAQALELKHFPFRHARGSHRAGVRKVPVGSYLVYYSVNEAARTVTILRFWHSSRQPPFV
jgi:toxin ParE1/3/4